MHAIGQLRAVGALLQSCELKGWTQVFQPSRLTGPEVQYCFSGGIGDEARAESMEEACCSALLAAPAPQCSRFGHIWWWLFFLPS